MTVYISQGSSTGSSVASSSGASSVSGSTSTGSSGTSSGTSSSTSSGSSSGSSSSSDSSSQVIGDVKYLAQLFIFFCPDSVLTDPVVGGTREEDPPSQQDLADLDYFEDILNEITERPKIILCNSEEKSKAEAIEESKE